jgi:hypothetical protein
MLRSRAAGSGHIWQRRLRTLCATRVTWHTGRRRRRQTPRSCRQQERATQPSPCCRHAMKGAQIRPAGSARAKHTVQGTQRRRRAWRHQATGRPTPLQRCNARAAVARDKHLAAASCRRGAGCVLHVALQGVKYLAPPRRWPHPSLRHFARTPPYTRRTCALLMPRAAAPGTLFISAQRTLVTGTQKSCDEARQALPQAAKSAPRGHRAAPVFTRAPA